MRLLLYIIVFALLAISLSSQADEPPYSRSNPRSAAHARLDMWTSGDPGGFRNIYDLSDQVCLDSLYFGDPILDYGDPDTSVFHCETSDDVITDEMMNKCAYNFPVLNSGIPIYVDHVVKDTLEGYHSSGFRWLQGMGLKMCELSAEYSVREGYTIIRVTPRPLGDMLLVFPPRKSDVILYVFDQTTAEMLSMGPEIDGSFGPTSLKEVASRIVKEVMLYRADPIEYRRNNRELKSSLGSSN